MYDEGEAGARKGAVKYKYFIYDSSIALGCDWLWLMCKELGIPAGPFAVKNPKKNQNPYKKN